MIATLRPDSTVTRGIRTRSGPLEERDERPALQELLAMLRLGRPNVLLCERAGRQRGRTVDHMAAYLREPVVTWHPRQSRHLPTGHFRTLVIYDVDQLDAAQQDRLLRYIDQSAGTVQIVSIARAPLFPSVRRAAFSDRLYYRLNVVLFESDGAA